jgi:tetratricopeptide (TPR) repeat protein
VPEGFTFGVLLSAGRFVSKFAMSIFRYFAAPWILRKEIKRAAVSARQDIDGKDEHQELWPVLKAVGPEASPELVKSVVDLPNDLDGAGLRKTLGQIFKTEGQDEALRTRAADAFYEAVLRALLEVDRLKSRAKSLLDDIDAGQRDEKLEALKEKTDGGFQALLGPDALVQPPYKDLPTRGDRLSDLLRAEYRVVPFLGRQEEIDDILAWANGGDGIAMRLYFGDGGQGKTRFFAEVCSRLMERDDENWTAGWLNLARCEREPARLDELLKTDCNLFLGVDYAGSELEKIISVANQIADANPTGEVRLVLLERQKGSWWETVHNETAHRFDTVRPVEMAPLGDEFDRTTIFQAALEAFNKALGRASTAPADLNLSADEFGNVLFIVMAAALAADGDPAHEAGAVLDMHLKHEGRWRRDCAKSQGLNIDAKQLTLAAAIGTLVDSVEDKEKAFEVLRRVSSFEKKGDDFLESMCCALGSRTGSDLPALKPDRLGERLLETIFVGTDTALAEKLLDAVFTTGDEATNLRCFVTLDRMARRDPQGKWLLLLASYDLDGFLPFYNLVLLEFSALLTGLAAEIRPQLEEDETEAKRQRARLKNNLAVRLSYLGRREEALLAAQEAVDIYRELAAARPDAFRPDLAASLNNVANRLSDLGRREEALQAAQDAVEIRRELAAARPDAFRPDLAMSLNNVANRLSGLGRREEALQAAQEAVEIYRELAAARPDAFRPDLATSVNNVAGFLSGLGRREEALQAAQEAVEIRRELAAARPDAFRPDLAASLNNVANRLSHLNRHRKALLAVQEAVNNYRDLAAARPEAFRPDLAMGLNNLANCFSNLGRREEALQAAQEAVDIRRELAAARPDAFRPDLAVSLGVLGNVYRGLEDHKKSAEAFKEGLAMILPYFAKLPQAFAQLTGYLAQEYVEACEKAGIEPDEKLLGDVDRIMKTLKKE